MSNSVHVPIYEIPKLIELHFERSEALLEKHHSPFYINRLEDAVTKLKFPLPPHRKTVYDLLFLTEGKSIRSKGLNTYHFSKNQFFFLPPLQITSHEKMSPDIAGFFLHFSPKIFKDKLHLLKSFSFLHLHTSPIVSMPEKHITPVLNILERLTGLFEDGGEKQLDLVVWYLLALFEEANRYTILPQEQEKNVGAASLLTQRYKEALTEHIYTCRTVEDFAKTLHVTPNHLNKCVKKTLEKTAQSLLNEMLVLEAQSLLRYSDLTISQIAYNLYRSSPSNFSRFFKNQTGMSPSAYLKQQEN